MQDDLNDHIPADLSNIQYLSLIIWMDGSSGHIAIEVHPLVNPGFAVRTLRVSQLVHAPLKPPN